MVIYLKVIRIYKYLCSNNLFIIYNKFGIMLDIKDINVINIAFVI